MVVCCSDRQPLCCPLHTGVVIPNQAAEHYYLVSTRPSDEGFILSAQITDTIEGVDPNWPVIEDPSSFTYIRPEARQICGDRLTCAQGSGLMVGLFEPEAAAWAVTGVPSHFSYFTRLLSRAQRPPAQVRIPAARLGADHALPGQGHAPSASHAHRRHEASLLWQALQPPASPPPPTSRACASGPESFTPDLSPLLGSVTGDSWVALAAV